MKKYIVFILFLLLTNTNICGQTRKIIDSLNHELSKVTQDSSRVLLLANLSGIFRLVNIDSSIIYGEKAYTMAKVLNYPKGEVLALGNISMAQSHTGNFPIALKQGLNALSIADFYHLKNEKSMALSSINGIYRSLKDYKSTLKYSKQMYQIGLSTGGLGLAYSELDLGLAFYNLNQLDSSIYYTKKSIASFQKIGLRVEPIDILLLGDIKMKQRNIVSALSFYHDGLLSSIKNNEPRSTSLAFLDIANLYSYLNQPDSGIFYAKKAFKISKQLSQREGILNASTLLSTLYEPIDVKEALKFNKIANSLKDSLYGSANFQAIQTIIRQDEEHKKEVEDAKINYQSKLKAYTIYTGIGILLIIAFILYRNNLKEKKAKIILQDKNRIIEQTLNHLKATQTQLIQSEKMASLGELTAGIAHEIQNPLNFVNNFSEVSIELLSELKEEEEKGNKVEVIALANDLTQNLEKINHHGKRADAIVKGMLEHSRSGSGVKEPTDINKLADEYLRLSYHGLRAKDKSFNAEMITNFDEKLPLVNVIPQDIGRVLLNLFNNAFYAVNQKQKTDSAEYQPEVVVTTFTENGQLVIKVKDNGIGIPDAIKDKIMQPFFTTKPTGEGTGLGLSLTYDMVVKGHGGTIEVNSKDGEGSEFVITVPIM